MTMEKILGFLNSTVGWIVIGVVIFLGTTVYFQTSSIWVNKDPVVPAQPTYPPVDYSIDKNRLSCILSRTPKEVQDLCDQAFPVKK